MDTFAGTTAHDIDLPGGRIRYYLAGTSGPALVLLHGGVLDCAEQAWGEIVPRLSDRFRLYALDWPEHGGSWPARSGTGEAVLGDVLIRLVDHWRLDRFHLVGSSQGGGIATRFALDHPERVERMIAIGPVGYDDRRLVLAAMSVLVRIPHLARLVTRLLSRFPWLVRLSLRAARTRGERTIGFEESVALGVEQVRRADRHGSTIVDDYLVDSFARLHDRIDYRPEVHRLSVPTLIVRGSRDLTTSERALRWAAGVMPSGRFRSIEGAGHLVSRDDPRAVAAIIEEFLLADLQSEPRQGLADQ